jgi:hypothetical protein
VKTEKDTTQPGIELKRTTEIVSQTPVAAAPALPYFGPLCCLDGRPHAGPRTKYRAMGRRPLPQEFAPRWDFGLPRAC